jgi:hypothetical protein
LVAAASAEWDDAHVQQPRRTGAATPTGTRNQPTSVNGGVAAEYLNVGSFRFWFAGERWEWSDEVARMHGYEPGSVAPTTKLMLSHKHPDDLEDVRDLLHHALHSGESFSSRHRFIDTAGDVHDAIVVADRLLDEVGAVLGTASTSPTPSTKPDLRPAKRSSMRRSRTCSRTGRLSNKPRAC